MLKCVFRYDVLLPVLTIAFICIDCKLIYQNHKAGSIKFHTSTPCGVGRFRKSMGKTSMQLVHYLNKDETLILVNFELLLIKYQINTNTNQNWFLFPKKFEERILNYSFFVSITLNS